MQLRSLAAGLVMLALAGCDTQVRVGGDAVDDNTAPAFDGGEAAEDTENGEGFSLQIPGVDVKVGNDGRVDVKAPGTDVQYSAEEGVRVRAPGTEVDVAPKGRYGE